jgi:thiamine-phosphate pyrophosphorylase
MATAVTAAMPCQIYLVVDAGPSAAERLQAVLATGTVGSVLIVPAPGQKLTAAAVTPLIGLAHQRNVAVLLTDDAALAKSQRSDGVHLSAGQDVVERYQAARAMLGAAASIGADAGGSRHLAMELGEAGCDYIAFSAERVEIDAGDDHVAGPATAAELVAWWSEVFEVPCVAFDAADPGAAREAARLGADFVAVHVASGQTIATIAAHVQAIRRSLEARHGE